MKNIISYLVLISVLFVINVNALDVELVAKDLNLSAGSKAAIQWKRVFKSERKMKRYKIDTLDDAIKISLEEYLINHAIDSDKPTVAGGF